MLSSISIILIWNMDPSALNGNNTRRESASTLKDRKDLDILLEDVAKTYYVLQN